MNGFVQALLALMAAVGTTTGGVQANTGAVSKPAVIAPASSNVPSLLSSQVEITGTITSISGTVIVVNGQEIQVAPGAEVKGDLTVGTMVKIEGKIVNGQFVATEIEAAQEKETDKDQGEDTHETEVEENHDTGNHSEVEQHNDKSTDDRSSDDRKGDDHEEDDHKAGDD